MELLFVLAQMSTNFTGARGLKNLPLAVHLIYKDLNITSEKILNLYTLIL